MAQTTDFTNKVPSSIDQTRIVTKYTLLDYIRSRRFFILLLITVAIGAGLTAVAYYNPSGTFRDTSLDLYSNWWGITATLLVVLSAVFFGGDAISGEFQNRTGYYGIPNPIRRSSIYIGKWLSAFIASSVIIGLFAVITIANGAAYFGTVPTQFLESLGFTWFYLVAALGFTFFFSALFKNALYSILVNLFLFLLIFNVVDEICQRFVGIEPWFSITYGGGIVGSILQSPYPAHAVTETLRNGRTITVYTATVPEGLAIIGIYFVVTAVLGLLLFERKEFN